MTLRHLSAACFWAVATLAHVAVHGAGYLTTDALYDPQTLRALAERGDTRAAFLLASRFAAGRGGVRDDKEAVYWFRAAAEGGLAEAQYNLGVMYATGRGVPRDLAQAAHWYSLAAEQGLAEAEFNLGTLYGTGAGLGRDDKLAAKWLERAARKGVPEAQYNLGALYEHGRGVPQDRNQARAWYERAAEQGFDPARARSAARSENLPVAPSAAAAPVPASNWAPWLDRSGYTLQLASFVRREDAVRLAARLPENEPAAIYRFSNGGKLWYSVVVGSFASFPQAKAAVDQLPPALRRLRPWARKVASVLAERI